MSRARELSRLANENVFSVDASNNVGINSTTPDARLDVVGVVSATSFFGDGTGLTGVASTENIITGTAATFTGGIDAAQSDVSVRNLTGVAATFTGVLTYEDVTNIDSIGVVTARAGIRVGAGQSIGSDGAAVVYYGDGSNLDGVVSGVEIKQDGSSQGTSQTILDFAGATVASSGSASTITIAAAGLTTTASSASGIVTFLSLSNAQDHKLTVSGITTISCTGGTEGESHTVRIVNSGIATVGFSTYFLFPSGAAPSLPITSGAISLISFTVHRVGAGGTQLLAGASVNYS